EHDQRGVQVLDPPGVPVLTSCHRPRRHLGTRPRGQAPRLSDAWATWSQGVVFGVAEPRGQAPRLSGPWDTGSHVEGAGVAEPRGKAPRLSHAGATWSQGVV